MTPPPTRVRKIFNAVQWFLLAVAGLMAAAGVVKAFRHRHDIVLAMNGGDWIDDGWYFLSMGVAALGIVAVVLGFALVQWRRGGSYLAPFALLTSVAAVDLTFETFGMGIGKALGAPDDLHSVVVHYWGRPVTGLAIAALCLFGTWRLSWRTGAKD